ncbi:protein NRT1/ PTR FAMILY 6.4-like [Oryza glaberrima]|uniref:protein NRT1/ PTR FAMILY 6.4-like n=1 Tax=Oryza glaberrima TaxID=4538 RepID=UPI00023E2423|nr:protein NRT1/ PTR FAMILY 6.4-like [Oryza glaberrima]
MVSAGVHGGDDGVVVDFRGNPVDKGRTGGWLGAGLILGTELAERVCVVAISMNLVTYLVGDLHLSNARSANIVTNFLGTLNLLALLGGFLADAVLGRYLTVAVSATIAAIGVSLLAASTVVPGMRPPPCGDAAAAAAAAAESGGCVAASGGQMAMLYAALYTAAAGAGGLKANVSGFGSDQFDGRDRREGKAMLFFFNRFYFCISLGSVLAVTALVYVQEDVGRGWGYGASAAAMVAAVAVFAAGTPRYRYRRPQGSPLTAIGRVLWAAWRKRRMPFPADAGELHGFHKAKVPHTNRLRCLDKAAIVEADLAAATPPEQPVAALTVTEVEEAKMVVKLLPIWSTSILFWTVYSQMTTFSVEQASHMDRRAGGFAVPAGSFSVFLFLSILLFTSASERLLVPLARRLMITRRPQGLTSLQRVGAGLVLATLAMAVSALVEKKRRDASGGAGGGGVAMISAFWLVPQFFLVGAGEAFAYVGQLEFFIREAPERMKSMSTGLFLATLAMGFFLSSLLVSAVDAATRGAWIRDGLDDGRLDLFYWMLAALGVANFAAFLVFASRHQYRPAILPAADSPPDDEGAVREAATTVKGMDF